MNNIRYVSCGAAGRSYRILESTSGPVDTVNRDIKWPVTHKEHIFGY